jgi:hypothetical protein
MDEHFFLNESKMTEINKKIINLGLKMNHNELTAGRVLYDYRNTEDWKYEDTRAIENGN